ncbi:acetate non-utilizing protein 9 [Thoreauomyces humboldtii]|nr:acetate non-utilizing protein 9 [Thoreauomyces humboldtii]
MSSLPPVLNLYRAIRRLHKKLPPALRVVGNNYVRDEFRRHKKADPPFVSGFLKEWIFYRDTLVDQIQGQAQGQGQHDRRDPTRTMLGRRLDKDLLESLSDQQIGQLHALREAARGKE